MVEPILTAPINVDVAVEEVASKLPTVSCVPVAARLPEALVVMMEFGAKVVAVKTCDAKDDVEIVETIPLVPVKAKPWVKDGK